MNNNIYHIKTMLGALVLAGIMTGCADDEVRDITPAGIIPQEEFDAPESDDISKALAAIEGISDVTIDHAIIGKKKAYFFSVEMPVSHLEETGQTFPLRCALEYEGADAPVIFYTSGYEVGNGADNLAENDMKGFLKANVLHMEHRYFGKSQPQSLNDISYRYLWAEECAFDMHRVVTLLKEKFFKGGNRWVSTGLGKGGVTAALYAYYSDLHGWNDMNLYVPFAAPFPTATPASCEDKTPGTYLVNVCGSGYDEGSDEDKAFKYLRDYPNCIANSKALRDVCLRIFYLKYPDLYLGALKAYPSNVEQAATAVVLSVFYDNLSGKFSYLPFSRWAPLVPDPRTATAPEATTRDIDNVVTFIFSTSEGLDAMLPDNTDEDFLMTTRGYTADEVRRHRQRGERNESYRIQSLRELGSMRFDYSLLTSGTFLTAAAAADINANVSETEALYRDVYPNAWDGGQLMKNVRNWLHTTQKPLLFVYGTSDPWTGAAIPDITDNVNVRRVMVPGVGISNEFMTAFDKNTSLVIQNIISSYIKR